MNLVLFVPELIYRSLFSPLLEAGKNVVVGFRTSEPPYQGRSLKRFKLRKTSSKVASAAGRALSSKKSTRHGRTAAASALAQYSRPSVTSDKAARSAGKALRSTKTTKAGRRAAGSVLSQKRAAR